MVFVNVNKVLGLNVLKVLYIFSLYDCLSSCVVCFRGRVLDMLISECFNVRIGLLMKWFINGVNCCL